MSDDYKRLYRSLDDRMVAGVCGGVAKYFSLDPTLVRLLFVIFSIAGGPGLIAYIIMMIVVPEEPKDALAPSDAPDAPQATIEVETDESE